MSAEDWFESRRSMDTYVYPYTYVSTGAHSMLIRWDFSLMCKQTRHELLQRNDAMEENTDCQS